MKIEYITYTAVKKIYISIILSAKNNFYLL